MPFSAAHTHVLQLTPVGRGAIASVAVEGPHAERAVAHCFEPWGGCSSEFRIGRIYVGRWHGGGPSEGGEELVVCRTSDQRIEVHCHGGQAAVESIVSSLGRLGVTRQPWDSAFPNANAQWQHHVAMALSQATTDRTALILLDQYHGALDRQVEEILKWVDQQAYSLAAARVQRLLDDAELGAHLTQPWQVAIAGPPNVGKSTLMNAILGFQRVVVYDQPGTTRDVVVAQTAMDGWPVQLADTAGLRPSDDPLEAAGIRRSQAQLAEADLVLEVRAADHPGRDGDTFGVRRHRALSIVNKCDVATDRQLADVPGDAIQVSALTGSGLEQLISEISLRLVPRTPPPGAALPVLASQRLALRAAAEALAALDLPTARDALQSMRC